ncbi:MAG: ThuA domain-containing protein [Planctomycetota bacterium]
MFVESRAIVGSFIIAVAAMSFNATADELNLRLRYQEETELESRRFHVLTREAEWKPSETALIICDAWDAHHCLNAVRRLEQFAPRLNKVVKEARERGVTIIHAPSDCMEFYKDHPARRRAMEIPQKESLPADIKSWCSAIPTEERGVWPIDQSDGGEDDDPVEHAEWAAKLKSQGRNPGTPWMRQTELITIDTNKDYISDKGDEVWRILQSHQIKNVILTGVHTNMCVVGRPFGLRQMVRNRFNTVLMRDMTDTMYNPKRWPYVSHFTGTDLVVSHIERHVCPTITSDQLIGGKPFRFKKDTRPRLAIISAEDEYETSRTLPKFASEQLGHDFSTTLIFGNAKERNDIPGIQSISQADIVLVSVRRRWLPMADMKLLKEFVAAGKPVVGIRTASHAFTVRNKSPQEGMAEWTTLDQQVFGGNYHDHHGNKLKSTVRVAPNAAHPVLQGITSREFAQGGSLYKTSPLLNGATVLMTGTVEGFPAEPVAWTFKRADGGKSFYTSLGSPGDFDNPEFVRLLHNGLRWAAGLETAAPSPTNGPDNHVSKWH